eukprot:13831136-Ditylum_brightwellii.AAC.1
MVESLSKWLAETVNVINLEATTGKTAQVTGRAKTWVVAQLLYRSCDPTDESGCWWSPWEGL